MSPSIIFKYRLLPTRGKQTIEMAEPHRVLSLGVQAGHIMMWAICRDPQYAPSMARTHPRDFWLFYTGESLPEDLPDLDFIGTATVDGLVYHVFGSQRL